LLSNIAQTSFDLLKNVVLLLYVINTCIEIRTCVLSTLTWFIEEFEDTKGAIRIRISKNRLHNGQKKKYKRTNNDQQNIHIKLKIE